MRREIDIIDALHYLAFNEDKVQIKGTDVNEFNECNFNGFNITDNNFISNDICKKYRRK